jgi:hypothetical protein
MAKGHINHQFVDATPTRSAAGLEARGPQCLLWASRNGRHTRVAKLRLGDGSAIWRTSLTSGDTMLVWTALGTVAVQ